MSAEFKILPELRVIADGVIASIQTGKGAVLAEGNVEAAERLVECWNALREIAFPSAHLKATDEYLARLERLRKEASAGAVTGGPVWSSDFSAAPRDRQILVRTTGDRGRVFVTAWIERDKDIPHRMVESRWDGFPQNAKTLLAWCEIPAFNL